MKKFYQEIHLKKIEDIAPDFLLSKAYDELHMTFVAIAPDGNCPFGIGFPEYDAMQMNLGMTLQIFSDSREMFDLLALSKRFRKYRDYLSISEVKETPTPRAYVSFSRFHRDSPAKIRRYAKRHQLTFEKAKSMFHLSKLKKLPYVFIDSQSTGMRFPLCIQMKEHETPIEGCFGNYGLSSTTTVPVW